ncbi:MAG TPA: flagellar basal body L-ring protein FlgH [Acidobacteriota bacterium]|nr:flagellar basal body L-ring protein FlgH [Acidobacteriota bacterium]
MKMFRTFTLIAASALLASACGESAKHPGPVRSGLSQYVEQARNLPEDNREASGSLWTDRSQRSDVFRDVKAYQVADIVTIAVRESTSAVSQATTDSSKASDIESGADSLLGLEKHISELPSLLDGSRQTNFQGTASTTRSNSLITNVTARVVEVFSNGNLLLEGHREVVINGERQIVVVRGVVRPNDVSSNNIVASTSLAEMEISVEGRGIVSGAQKPGILYKILSGFWPF